MPCLARSRARALPVTTSAGRCSSFFVAGHRDPIASRPIRDPRERKAATIAATGRMLGTAADGDGMPPMQRVPSAPAAGGPTSMSDREPTASEALQTWRDAERQSARATAKREAADLAVEAATLADAAARATADASSLAADAATEAARAAGEAAKAANATADAAQRVLHATRIDDAAKLALEREAVASEVDAKAAHAAAVERARKAHGLEE
jgi:hypothetical protein